MTDFLISKFSPVALVCIERAIVGAVSNSVVGSDSRTSDAISPTIYLFTIYDQVRVGEKTCVDSSRHACCYMYLVFKNK